MKATNALSGYSFLEHTTDAYIQASGSSIEDAFRCAGQALVDTLCDRQSITPTPKGRITFQGTDEVSLLYDWLEKVFMKFELDEVVCSDFVVHPIRTSGEMLLGEAEVFGEQYDKEKHGAKVEVKAVTYHRMDVTRGITGVQVRFILDL